MTEYKPDICVWHGSCDDGFGAAWAVWKRWPDCEFMPGVHGKVPPVNYLAGKSVLMVDFSYPYDVLLDLSFKTKRIVVLDHHITAYEALSPFAAMACSIEDMEVQAYFCRNSGVPEVMAHFDMEHSGAALAWKFCFPEKEMPDLIRYVEDRDLWRFAHENTKLFSAALRTYPMEFEQWDLLAANVWNLVEEGSTVLRAHEANIEKFTRDVFTELIGGHLVPCCNVPYHYASDTAHALLSQHPTAPFAACWFKRGDGQYQFSLRSEDRRADASEIAKLYRGGGHRNAAGFQLVSLAELRL